METRQQGSTLFSAVLVLIAMLVVIQLWLVAAALDALMARQIVVLVPTARRVGRAVRVERRTALVRRVVRRAAAPVGPAWLIAPPAPAARRPRPGGHAQPRGTTPAHAPADALFGAPGLGALHVPERLHHDRAAGRRSRWCRARRSCFPSLGPTAFLFFFTPRAPAASPRHTIYGHAIGIVCGYGALWLFGLAARAAGDGDRRLGRARRRRGAVAGVDGRVDDSAESGAPAGRRDDPHHLARDRDAAVPPARDRDRRRHPDAAGDRHQPARRHRLSALGAQNRYPTGNWRTTIRDLTAGLTISHAARRGSGGRRESGTLQRAGRQRSLISRRPRANAERIRLGVGLQGFRYAAPLGSADVCRRIRVGCRHLRSPAVEVRASGWQRGRRPSRARGDLCGRRAARSAPGVACAPRPVRRPTTSPASRSSRQCSSASTSPARIVVLMLRAVRRSSYAVARGDVGAARAGQAGADARASSRATAPARTWPSPTSASATSSSILPHEICPVDGEVIAGRTARWTSRT